LREADFRPPGFLRPDFHSKKREFREFAQVLPLFPRPSTRRFPNNRWFLKFPTVCFPSLRGFPPLLRLPIQKHAPPTAPASWSIGANLWHHAIPWTRVILLLRAILLPRGPLLPRALLLLRGLPSVRAILLLRGRFSLQGTWPSSSPEIQRSFLPAKKMRKSRPATPVPA